MKHAMSREANLIEVIEFRTHRKGSRRPIGCDKHMENRALTIKMDNTPTREAGGGI
jgi:hypothetical protein